MSPIPDFDPQGEYPWGVLPAGVHECTEAELFDRFVEPFARSATRSRVWEGFRMWKECLSSSGIGILMWIDGSFVEEKPDPDDVDVVSFADYDALLGMSSAEQQEVESLLAGGESTLDEFSVHTFLVPSCSPGHPWYPSFARQRQYWRRWFGRTRERESRQGDHLVSVEKGLVEMKAGIVGAVPAILDERGSSQ